MRQTPSMTIDTARSGWADFAAAAPELAAAGARHLDRAEGAALLATVRAEAPPRIHPVTVGNFSCFENSSRYRILSRW